MIQGLKPKKCELTGTKMIFKSSIELTYQNKNCQKKIQNKL
jgi:hypothetical protein